MLTFSSTTWCRWHGWCGYKWQICNRLGSSRSMQSILIYAELLLNIRQVTLLVTLPSEHNDQTEVHISSDCQQISVNHEGHTASVRLPLVIASNDSLALPVTRTKLLSFRLNVTGNVKPYKSNNADSEADAPWSASSLKADSHITCGNCHSSITHGKLNVWKDLPSEHWAEVMDFWHCHKPDTLDGSQDDYSSMKGYAACNQLNVRPGVGFVESLNIVLSKQDCSNIQVCVWPEQPCASDIVFSAKPMSCNPSG